MANPITLSCPGSSGASREVLDSPDKPGSDGIQLGALFPMPAFQFHSAELVRIRTH